MAEPPVQPAALGYDNAPPSDRLTVLAEADGGFTVTIHGVPLVPQLFRAAIMGLAAPFVLIGLIVLAAVATITYKDGVSPYLVLMRIVGNWQQAPVGRMADLIWKFMQFTVPGALFFGLLAWRRSDMLRVSPDAVRRRGWSATRVYPREVFVRIRAVRSAVFATTTDRSEFLLIHARAKADARWLVRFLCHQLELSEDGSARPGYPPGGS